jgi:hypothetical protein
MSSSPCVQSRRATREGLCDFTAARELFARRRAARATLQVRKGLSSCSANRSPFSYSSPDDVEQTSARPIMPRERSEAAAQVIAVVFDAVRAARRHTTSLNARRRGGAHRLEPRRTSFAILRRRTRMRRCYCA